MHEEIRQELLRLTDLHKRRLQANDVIGRLFAPLINEASPPPTWSELEQAKKDLEQRIPGYFIWFEPVHARYVLVPKTDQENGKQWLAMRDGNAVSNRRDPQSIGGDQDQAQQTENERNGYI